MTSEEIAQEVERRLNEVQEEIAELKDLRDKVFKFRPRKARKSASPSRRERPGRRSATAKQAPTEKKAEQNKAPAKASPGSRPQQALKAVAATPGIKTADVAQKIGVSPNHASMLMKRLQMRGRVEGAHKTGWKLTR